MCESECAENVSTPANPISTSSSSSSQDSKDRSAATMVGKSEPAKGGPEPAKGGPEPTGSSPIMVLSSIRPGIQYFEIINSQDETLRKSTGLKLYRMGVLIDGERFEGSATSKKLAKCYAAEEGLKKLFGLECAHTSSKKRRYSVKLYSFWIHNIHSLIPVISIAPIQVHYYSEALLTTALILCRS